MHRGIITRFFQLFNDSWPFLLWIESGKFLDITIGEFIWRLADDFRHDFDAVVDSTCDLSFGRKVLIAAKRDDDDHCRGNDLLDVGRECMEAADALIEHLLAFFGIHVLETVSRSRCLLLDFLAILLRERFFGLVACLRQSL